MHGMNMQDSIEKKHRNICLSSLLLWDICTIVVLRLIYVLNNIFLRCLFRVNSMKFNDFLKNKI